MVTPQALKDVALLRCFEDAELAELIALGTTETIARDTNVVIEGDPSGGLYVILDGAVGVFKLNPATSDLVEVAQLRTGQFFGEMSLIDNQPRSATVRALLDLSVFRLDTTQFDQFLAGKPGRRLQFLEACVGELARRLRELDESYVVSQYQLWKVAVEQNREAA